MTARWPRQPCFTKIIVPGAWAGLTREARDLVPMGLAPERNNLMARGLPQNVIATIPSASAPSTRGLYAYKWKAFELWCRKKGLVLFQWSVRDILMFLQELFRAGVGPSPCLEVYMATISTCHVGIGRASAKHVGDLHALSVHPSCIQFAPGD